MTLISFFSTLKSQKVDKYLNTVYFLSCVFFTQIYLTSVSRRLLPFIMNAGLLFLYFYGERRRPMRTLVRDCKVT